MESWEERIARRRAELNARVEADEREEQERLAASAANDAVEHRTSGALRSTVFMLGLILITGTLIMLAITFSRLSGRDFSEAERTGQAEVASCEQRGPVSTKGFGRWQSCTASVFWDDGDNEYVYGTEMFTSADIGTPVRVGEVGRHRTEPVLARADAGERPWLRWIGYLVLIIAIPPGLLTTLLLSAMLRSRKR
ncbi:DUF6346 domain-containing protein [Actinoplanes aureus]|uniref:Uncharacterized protein n=1 Tax=Actinoplanes aureus TaxID=2792083 RepID=A0A931C9J4_9ACTN|nr:DUF6346 domain-containing protein [Actinoplanes aureus]MBG0563018.1 hypothetical protein [Actinoplanes aureus]